MNTLETQALQQTDSKQRIFHAAANLVNKGEYGTMILDRVGRILSCGSAAEKIFATDPVRLIGRRISDFIGGLFLAGSSPSYNARYMVYLAADGEWRTFSAKSADGREFAVELNLSRMQSDGREIFLLNVRRPETTPDR